MTPDLADRGASLVAHHGEARPLGARLARRHPLVLFIIPALAGHPAIDADNLIQNFPLRVLAGRQLAPATSHCSIR